MDPDEIQAIKTRHNVLTREEFHSRLSDEEREFFRYLNEKLGPLTIEWALSVEPEKEEA